MDQRGGLRSVGTGSKATPSNATTIKEHELRQVDRANKTGLGPLVFVHGLWLLPSNWERWAGVKQHVSDRSEGDHQQIRCVAGLRNEKLFPPNYF